MRGMTDKDVVFKYYSPEERSDPNRYCHFGWEGEGYFAFWKFARSYYESAEVLFERFKSAEGDYATLDGLGVTICFLYRHFIELSIKYLFLKFVYVDDNQFKRFLGKGHNMKDLWIEIEPKLSELCERVGSSVSLKSIEHYITEFDRFDQSGDSMRYPIKKNLMVMHEPTRLDILILHERMNDFQSSIETLSFEIENQLFEDVSQPEIELFEEYYSKLKPIITAFLDTVKSISSIKNEKIENVDYSLFNLVMDYPDPLQEAIDKCTSDEIILMDALFYTGRAILSGDLKLPKSPQEARQDAIKLSILSMERDGNVFGKPANDVNLYCKSSHSIYYNLMKALSVIG